MEIDWVSFVDPWPTYVPLLSVFLLFTLSDVLAGSGKSILWHVLQQPFFEMFIHGSLAQQSSKMSRTCVGLDQQ